MSILLLLLMVWPCLAETASDDSTATRSQTQQKLEINSEPSVEDTSRVEQKERVVVKEKEKPNESKNSKKYSHRLRGRDRSGPCCGWGYLPHHGVVGASKLARIKDLILGVLAGAIPLILYRLDWIAVLEIWTVLCIVDLAGHTYRKTLLDDQSRTVFISLTLLVSLYFLPSTVTLERQS